MKEYVQNLINKELGEIYPIEVVSADTDPTFMQVRVFNVPEDKEDEVIVKIMHVDDLLEDEEIALLGSIKTPEVTREYYPEFAV